MKMSSILAKSTLFDKLILTNLALVGLIIWLTINNSAKSFISAVFYGTFFILIWSFFEHPFLIRREVSHMVTLISYISLVNVLISSVIGNGSFDFNYFVNYFAFVFLLLYIMLMCSYKPTYNIGIAILWVEIGISAIYALSYYVLHNVTYEFLGYFTMNFSNSNLLAVFLYQSVLFCLVSFFVMQKYWLKTLCAIIGVADFNLMMMADSRNCIISFAIVVVATIYFMIKKKYRISPWILKFVAVFPLVFVWIYLSYVTVINIEGDTLLNHEGKSVMSRVHIWNYVLDNLDGVNFIFGNYPIIQGNAHNSHLSVLAGFGVIVAILFVVFLYKVMKHCSENLHSYKQAVCLVGFMGTIFIGMGEGALVCGSLGLYIPACTFLCLASVDWSEQNKLNSQK